MFFSGQWRMAQTERSDMRTYVFYREPTYKNFQSGMSSRESCSFIQSASSNGIRHIRKTPTIARN